MSRGTERALAQPLSGTEPTEDEALEASPEGESTWIAAGEPEEAPPAPKGPKIFAGLLVLLALGWTGAAAYTFYEARVEPTLPAVLSWIATASVPLVLLGLLWLIFGRTSRRETERFTRAVAAMRSESQSLESVLAIVAARIEENRLRISEEAGRLMALGDEASDRLGRVTHYISRESSELSRKSQALESAAANARVDIGVLLSDLPQAEEQARAAAESIKQAGLAAHQHAGALEGQLTSLTARGREADEVVGGAAQRLGAHLARIESSAAGASKRMDEAAAQLNAAVDGAMARASDSVDQTRSSLSAQGEAMLALVEQGRAAFEQAGAEASRNIAEKIEQVGRKIEALAARLAEQEGATEALVTRLSGQIAELEERIASAGRTGSDTHDQLRQTVDSIRASIRDLQSEVETGQGQSGELIGRVRDMSDALSAVTRQLREEVPASLSAVEDQASRAMPSVEAVQSAAALAAQSLSDGEASVSRQKNALDALLSTVREGVGEVENRIRALAAAVGETDGAAARLVQETGPQLISALVRVREAAGQAAAHAREAIAAAIPESAAALAEASREALGEALTETVREQVAGLESESQRAAEAARLAAERLTRQLLTIGETAAAVEARIADHRAEREEKEAETLSRRVSLIIESLNSTAIDVNKILSNEITDTAWSAYLKGDRGVFARRAVRLLGSGEAREILRHYESEPEFREQVNRYILDFEAMLRRVLADRDGTPLGVTLLSSDMGKLYVALAQAIERLRK